VTNLSNKTNRPAISSPVLGELPSVENQARRTWAESPMKLSTRPTKEAKVLEAVVTPEVR